MNETLLIKMFRSNWNIKMYTLSHFIQQNNVPYFMGLDDSDIGYICTSSVLLRDSVMKNGIRSYMIHLNQFEEELLRTDEGFKYRDMDFDNEGRLLRYNGKIFEYFEGTGIIKNCIGGAVNLTINNEDGSITKRINYKFKYSYINGKKRLISIIGDRGIAESFYYDKNKPIMVMDSTYINGVSVYNYRKVKYDER